MFRDVICADCPFSEKFDDAQTLRERIRSIYLDLKSGIVNVCARYNLDDVMAELNEPAGWRP